MKKIKRIINTFFILLLVFVILVNILILYYKVINKEPLVRIFGYSILVIVSGSMEPNVNIDDLLLIKKCDDYEVNDIITYQVGKNLITHRVVEVQEEEDRLVTKGDSNNTSDKPIEKRQVKGKMVFKIKNFGKIVNFIKSPIGILLLILCNYLIIKFTF
ncbi:MAG: signal peptidase I [Clostridia bacterium]|nr:signal peptidase I [Clostridia bacterium]